MIRKLSVKAVFIFTINILSLKSVLALSLHDALSVAYNNYEGFKLIQHDFLIELENTAKVYSRLSPRIKAEISNAYSSQSLSGGNNDLQPQLNSRIKRSLSVEQDIFNGTTISSLYEIGINFKLSKSVLYAEEQDLILKAVKVYLDKQAAQEIYDSIDGIVASKAKQLEGISLRYKLGQATKTDVANAEVGLTNAQLEKAKRLESYNKAKAEFELMFGLQTTSTIWPEILGGLPTDQDSFKKVVRDNNYNLAQVKYGLDLKKNRVNTATASLLPTASAQATLSSEPRRSDKNLQLVQKGLSLTLNIPILSEGGAEYSNIRKAKKDARKQVHHLTEAYKKIDIVSLNSWENYNTLQLTKTLAEQVVKAAEIAVTGTKASFNHGENNIIELLRAEDELYNMMVKKIEVRKDIILASYKMKSIMGQLTAKHLKLSGPYFDPDKEYKRMKWIGF